MSEKILRIGIAGTGARGVGSHAKMIFERKDAVVAAYFDANKLRMQYHADRAPYPVHCYTDLQEMIRKENLDAVVIATPDCFHAEHAVMAMEAGVNVLIEKPLASNVEGCLKIIRTAERTGRIAMMGFNLRHQPVLMKLKELIDQGIAGKVFMIENREFYSGGRSYMSRWNRLCKYTGGLWIHKGSHDFDVFQWLLGFPKPVKASSFAGVNILNEKHLPFELKPGIEPGPLCHKCPYLDQCPDAVKVSDINDGPWQDKITEVDHFYRDQCIYLSDKDTHDNGFAMVEYDNGARASHMECFITGVIDRRYTVIGTEGQLETSLEDRKITFVPRRGNDRRVFELPPDNGKGHGGADPLLMEQFIRVLKGEIPNRATCDHGMYSSAVGEACEIARRENRVVMIDELIAQAEKNIGIQK